MSSVLGTAVAARRNRGLFYDETRDQKMEEESSNFLPLIQRSVGYLITSFQELEQLFNSSF